MATDVQIVTEAEGQSWHPAVEALTLDVVPSGAAGVDARASANVCRVYADAIVAGQDRQCLEVRSPLTTRRPRRTRNAVRLLSLSPFVVVGWRAVAILDAGTAIRTCAREVRATAASSLSDRPEIGVVESNSASTACRASHRTERASTTSYAVCRPRHHWQ
eukprot:5152670-Prymnesium_polylepis.1